MLTTAQQVRLRIQDQPRRADVTRFADGTANTYYVPERNLTSGSAFLPAAGGWSATGAAFDVSGSVAFSAVLSANSAFRLSYTYSVFSDDEIDHMISAGGNVLGASMEAVQTLMFDSLKRASWRAPDGSSYDDTKAMDMLNSLYAKLKDELTEAADLGGGFQSWAEGQEYL